MLSMTTALKNAWLATSALKTLIDSGFIYVYSGPIPKDANGTPSAEAALDPSCVKLCKIDASAGAGTGVTWNGAPTNGVLQRTAAETWSGTNLATGTATFFRYCLGTDDGSAAYASQYRIQGTVGEDASFDADIGSTALTSGQLTTFNNDQLLI